MSDTSESECDVVFVDEEKIDLDTVLDCFEYIHDVNILGGVFGKCESENFVRFIMFLQTNELKYKNFSQKEIQLSWYNSHLDILNIIHRNVCAILSQKCIDKNLPHNILQFVYEYSYQDNL